MLITSLAQAPWPWSLSQPSRPAQAAPGSALAGPLAEDPEPAAEGAADAPAWGAVVRPKDQPAPQRVAPSPEGQDPRRQGQGQGQTPPQEAGAPAKQGGINIYV